MKSFKSFLRSRTAVAAAAGAMLGASVLPANALVVRDDVGVDGSEALADNPLYDGVVQIFFVNKATGGISFNCTGQMINPRTVLSAAHCFNSLPSTAYGAGAEPFTLLVAYGPDTSTALFSGPIFFNQSVQVDDRNGYSWASQVLIHPDADPAFGAPLNFPGADVAMIGLVDPLTTIPTYSMLFSPAPVGSHTVHVGYGSDGVGSTGPGGIDFKRQAGENILGLVGSTSEFFNAIGGNDNPSSAFRGAPDDAAAMYWIDFDLPGRTGDECVRGQDPLFGLADAISCSDWDGFSGSFVDGDTLVLPGPSIDYFPGDALPNEVATAGGDSGSAIFFDEYGDQLLIGGVLSGGFVDGFYHAANQSYGEVSYYNPLFNYYQFIVEQNPYKYVSATAGDGNWSDADRWVQDLDPAYMVFDEAGNLVNAIPDAPEPGVTGTDPSDGVVFDTPVLDDPGPNADPAPTGAIDSRAPLFTGTTGAEQGEPALADTGAAARTDFAASGDTGLTLGGVSAGATGTTGQIDGRADLSAPITLAQTPTDTTRPELATFLFGDVDAGPLDGPGSTGFVPNNGVNALGYVNYFDVTFSEAGTTTADIDAIVDRITLSNGGATLDVADGTVLVALIDTQILAGTLDVSGVYGSRDILNFGMLTGDGEIFADTVFNAGMFNARDGLAIGGDTVFTSASTILWTGGAFSVDGDVSLDGALRVGVNQFGQSGTLFTHTGDRVGEFADTDLPGVLFVDVTYGANEVSLFVDAEDFATFLPDEASANAQALGAYLDGQRDGFYSPLSDVYGTIDLLDPASLSITLDRLVPTSALGVQPLTLTGPETMRNQLDARFRTIRSGAANGVSVTSAPRGVQIASIGGNQEIASFLQVAESEEATGGGVSAGTSGDSNWGAFLEVAYIDGDAASLSGDQTGFDGYSITAGADVGVSGSVRLGGFANFTDASNSTDVNLLSSGETDSFSVGVYGSNDFGNGAMLTGYAGYGQRDIQTRRVALGNTLVGSTEADELMAGARVSALGQVLGNGFGVEPSLAIDYTGFDIDGYTETGGTGALEIQSRELNSVQVSLGGDLHLYDIREEANAPIRPRLGVRWVNELDDEPYALDTRLVGAGANVVTLQGPSRDKAWIEGEAAIGFNLVNGIEGSVFASSTFSRDDLEYETYGVTLRWQY